MYEDVLISFLFYFCRFVRSDSFSYFNLFSLSNDPIKLKNSLIKLNFQPHVMLHVLSIFFYCFLIKP